MLVLEVPTEYLSKHWNGITIEGVAKANSRSDL